MLPKLISALLKPFRFVAAKLRVPPVLLGLVLCCIAAVVLIAAFVGPTTTPTQVGAAARGPQRAAPTEMSYSALRTAMRAHTVKSAVLKPAQSTVDVVMKATSGLDRDMELPTWKVSIPYVSSDATKKQGWGYMDPQVWSNLSDTYQSLDQIPRKVTADEVMTNEIVLAAKTPKF